MIVIFCYICLYVRYSYICRLWVHEAPILEVIFVTLRELICCNKWHPGTLEISTSPEIALEWHFHAWCGTKTTSVFSLADGKASWSLLLSSVYLQSGSTVQPENTYSCTLKVTGQVWENQKRISINTNHSYHQHSSS